MWLGEGSGGSGACPPDTLPLEDGGGVSLGVASLPKLMSSASSPRRELERKGRRFSYNCVRK